MDKVEMKKCICMAEYQGRTDTEGNAVGHAPKVLAIYRSILEENGDKVQLMAPRSVLRAVPKEMTKGAKVLPHQILMKGHNSFFEKIFNKIKMFANIRLILTRTEAEDVWFFNTEYYLMLYLALFGNHGKNIVCTMFLDGWHGGIVAKIKQLIFQQAQKHIRMILASGESFRFAADSVFLPDYPYEEKLYDSLRAVKKEEKAVCLGTMGAEKDIEGLVECFAKMDYPLHIAGRFYDKDRVERLKTIAGEKTVIEDRYLSAEEYTALLSSAKFVVLPYAASQYATQTSGVLQEGMFMDVIPVTQKEILKNAGIPGIGISGWELTEEMLKNADAQEFYEKFRELRYRIYSRDYMRRTLKRVFWG